MNIYTKKQRWKGLLFLAAMLIVCLSLWYTSVLVNSIASDERKKVKLWADAIRKKAALVKYTNDLFDKIKKEERKKVELWAMGTKRLANASIDVQLDYDFLFEVIRNNETVPVILVNEDGQIVSHRNLDSTRSNDKEYLAAELAAMKKQQEPIEIIIGKGQKNLLYYKDSRLFSELKLVLDDLIQSFILEVAINSASVPVVYTDSTLHHIIAAGNLDTVQLRKNDAHWLQQTLSEMQSQNEPIVIDLGEGEKNYIFYRDSYLLTRLKYYPYAQFGVIGLFLLIAYILFSTARKAEQNQVWVGMAKETAHQLGTPLSSLIAWVEYLQSKGVEPTTLQELRQDVKRLEMITERFSKIGSQPVLDKQNIMTVLNDSIEYIRTRTSKNVQFTLTNESGHELLVPVNAPLFAWVIENVCKNAVDAMDGKGSINVMVSDHVQFIYIDISDTGKGIPKSKYKTIFEPGYTTKKRGWGLGLSLVKRIIENYHNGRIFVKSSDLSKGTVFRIVLNK